ncbi:MAG: hypothetical protein QOF83_2807 [Solirubrobacteraceae bacterium]|jgi:hypothetical protein|nr:hypothetical protein [Solirubrobacteraceae bacterium]
MMLSPGTRRWLALAPAAAILLAACGSSPGKVIDHNVVQNAIEVSVAQQQHVMTVATCPVGVRAKRGQTFRCTVTFGDGRQAPVTVTALDNRGDVHYAGLRGYVNGHRRAAISSR